jgi:hypothetical protein
MRAKDIENRIQFDTGKLEGQNTVFSAKLVLDAHLIISNIELEESKKQHKDITPDVRRILAEHIMRNLYEDQSDELMHAIMDLLVCDRMDFKAVDKARSRLMEIALRQQPIKR